MNKSIYSSLRLEKIVFDQIEFTRIGFKNDNEIKLELESEVAQRKNEDI